MDDLHPGHADVQPGELSRGLRPAEAAGVPALQPPGPRRRLGRQLVQHGRELHDQHQLAGLRRRDDDELSRADGRPDGAELRLGRRRHSSRDCAHPRLCPALGPDGRQLLGRSHAIDAVRAPAARDHRRFRAGRPGRAAEPERVCRCDDARRRQAGDRPGAGGLATGDQAARHERRRLLQRQLGPSLRESERDHQPDRDVGHPRDQRGADLHVRPHGARHAPGLGGLRGDGPAVPRRSHGDVLGRIGRQSRFRRARCRQRARHHAGGRQHGRQGGPLRHRQLGDLGHRDHGRVQRVGQLHARQLHAARAD